MEESRVARGDVGECFGRGSWGHRGIRTYRDAMATHMINNSELEDWLHHDRAVSTSAAYSHVLLTEDPLHRASGLMALKRYTDEAFADAKRHMLVPPEDSFDPLGAVREPYKGYPEELDQTTLQGYLGEVLAGLVAEHFSPFAVAWKVPAFLFRFHEDAFNLLARINQTGEPVTPIPGNQGNDCLAFVLNAQGRIAMALVCEAKCTTGHASSYVRQAHTQLSTAEQIPVSVHKIIQVLRDRSDQESVRWIAALEYLLWKGPEATYERCDLMIYVCGKTPRRRASWIDRAHRHQCYTATRRLEVAEVQLTEVSEVVAAVFSVAGSKGV
jgi:hypothetical protein